MDENYVGDRCRGPARHDKARWLACEGPAGQAGYVGMSREGEELPTHGRRPGMGTAELGGTLSGVR